MAFVLSVEDRDLLQRLEEELWVPERRWDTAYMESVLAEDFFEFGRSGRVYQRRDTISAEGYSFEAVFPLPDFEVRLISEDVAQVTYNSQATYDGVLLKARRSSIWLRMPQGWVLKFHQGTPFE